MSNSEYLQVLKASYDYEPQSEDELAIKEDQILLLLEKTDHEWWKVKIKESVDETEGGLVPSAYVEPAEHTSVVKVLYDYDAGAPGELTVKEDDELLVYDKDDDWLLVKSKHGDKVGYVPGNYVEEASEKHSASPPLAAPQIVVPPSPPQSPQPTSAYVDPAERRAAAAATSKAQTDQIQTWPVTEVDKKGKKKKGTLGVGNGAVFFASESDKTPVQKWQTGDVKSVKIEKSKHVYVDVGGATPTNLHLNAGSKDAAEAISAKLKSSAQLSVSPTSPPSGSTGAEYDEEVHKTKKNGPGVRFDTSPNAIIPPREPSDDGAADVQAETEPDDGGDGEAAAVLYDFTADGEDELSVQEGEQLLVLDKDSDEWWKCRNAQGHEGVVPASYVELVHASQNGCTHHGGTEEDEGDIATTREAEETARLERDEQERKRIEADRKRAEAERQAKAKATAEAAEDRKRRERELEEKAEAETRLKMERESEIRRERAKQPRPSSASGSQPPRSTQSPQQDATKSRPSTDSVRRPPKRTRVWHDRTGQFRVEAEFLGFSNGKLRLHKVNGVVIEVPAQKMSAEDMLFVEKWEARQNAGGASLSPAAGVISDDDEPLAVRRRSLQPESPKPATPRQAPVKKIPTVDWFEFFLSAGCDIDDCTRYATSFDRDKIDETILPDITDQTMRSLGLREGDIIRVKKAIAQRVAQPPKPAQTGLTEQMKRDEELARKLQEEESGGRPVPTRQTTSPAPNLFAGPGGVLKNNTQRRGRPQPSKSTPPATVDLSAIATASEQLTGGSGPLVASPVQGPPRASSAAPPAPAQVSGFDDDAWTNRPSSTKPITPTPVAAPARAASVPPAPPAPVPQGPTPVLASGPAPTTTASPPATQPQQDTAVSLSRTTESDVFDQLARLSKLRTQNPVISPPMGTRPTQSAPTLSPPVSYQHGLGMGTSPVPIGQHLQNKQAALQPQQPALGPRGPFAPVPANQGLLQPLIPTSTGFHSFVPTRPASNPPPSFQPQLPPQPSFLSTQPTGYGGIMRPQSTGFPGASPMLTQSTGFVPGFGGAAGFAGNNALGQVQPQPTGLSPFSANPGYNQMSFNSFAQPPPPVPPLPNTTSTNSSPANIFAQMKSGTFGSDSTPQPSDKYDALRPQPTGWGFQGASMTGYQNGFNGY